MSAFGAPILAGDWQAAHSLDIEIRRSLISMKVSELKNVKVLAAVAGGAAAVGLGVFGAVSGMHGAIGADSAAVASGSHMNVGQTSTETTPPTAPEVPMAVPAMKGNTPPSGFATTH